METLAHDQRSDHPRRVLMIAYHFPPLGGAGAQRPLKFVRHLPAFGFIPVVVTGPARNPNVWPPKDPSMTGEIPVDVPVYRIPEERMPETKTESTSLLDRVSERLLMRPSEFARTWVREAIEAGRRAAAEHPIDVIYCTMSPFESCPIAATLARELQVPWVADLRDPWALDEMTMYPSGLQRRLDERHMRTGLASASRILMNTPDATRALCKAFPELADRADTLTNGFDAEDFAGPAPPHKSERFTIVHTGHLHTRLGEEHRRTRRLRSWLGGERVPTDILTRSHVFLLQAIEKWLERRPEVRERVQLLLVGAINDADRRAVDTSPARDVVRIGGYLDHAASVEQLRSADLLFLPMQNLPRGERARLVPGKAYEYLAARRPILAAVPEGDARDLVLDSGLGSVCAPDDVSAMADILDQQFNERNDTRPAADEELLARFERKTLTRRLADTFSTLLAESTE